MADAGYNRPKICRLCGFPAANGSVQVSELDRDKLSKWCLLKLGTNLDDGSLVEANFCSICVMDARYVFATLFNADGSFFFNDFNRRFEGSHGKRESNCNWWSTCDNGVLDETLHQFYCGKHKAV
jgi:hypothetical protein